MKFRQPSLTCASHNSCTCTLLEWHLALNSTQPILSVCNVQLEQDGMADLLVALDTIYKSMDDGAKAKLDISPQEVSSSTQQSDSSIGSFGVFFQYLTLDCRLSKSSLQHTFKIACDVSMELVALVVNRKKNLLLNYYFKKVIIELFP